MPPFEQILILVKSCIFQHGLFCFLCKRYVLIFDNQDLVQLEAQVFFYWFLVCSNGFHYTCFAGVNAEGGNLYFIIIIVFNHVIHSCLQASFILYYNTNYCVDWSISNLIYEERKTSLGTDPLPSLSPREKSEEPLTEGSLSVVWLLSLKCNVCLSLSLKWEKWQNSDKHCKLVTLTSFARYAIANSKW